MAYLFSIMCMIIWFVNQESNYFGSGLALVAASIFWFAGNYYYKNKINLEDKENNNE